MRSMIMFRDINGKLCQVSYGSVTKDVDLVQDQGEAYSEITQDTDKLPHPKKAILTLIQFK